MTNRSSRQPLDRQRAGLYDPRFEHDSCGVGFLAHLRGVASHDIVRDANAMLYAMDHRGACGCEPNTGDGAGILVALPHAFLRQAAAAALAVELPAPGAYAAGLVFLPHDELERSYCKRTVELLVAQYGQRVLGWRSVPVGPDQADLGRTAREGMPVIEQLFVGAARGLREDTFERRLYLIRKRASHLLRADRRLRERQDFYVCSLSTRVLVYKGMLRPGQLVPFFPDLADPAFASHLAMVHSRFSTNTFPSWDRAQPNRLMCHNGEINTLRGNINWMHARSGVLRSSLFGEQLADLYPIIEPDCSDSGSFDNTLEFLLMTGRSLPEAITMMIPEAWQNDHAMADDKRAYYEYHSALLEPWDGPATIPFTDGRVIGAVLDRNGLRPSRYYVTDDERVIMASEVGVLQVPPESVVHKGRLEPGRMFLVDFERGRIVEAEETKGALARKRPYRRWLKRQAVDLAALEPRGPLGTIEVDTVVARMRAFGYTQETLNFMLRPLVRERRDPVGSMGNDAALACLSDQPRLLYDYLKQLFAQVTNPPIDSLREASVMTLECFIGPEHNLLETTAEHCRRLRVEHPILSNDELRALRDCDAPGLGAAVLDATFARTEGTPGLRHALLRLMGEAEAAVDKGFGFVVLSDRALTRERVPVPALLACGAVHHHLLRTKKRTRLGLVLETGEAREVHHHCLLLGYGADAINPYLAYEALWHGSRIGAAPARTDDDEVVRRYKAGTKKGILKVMAKMGISTLQSYKGAQIFEAVGLAAEVIEECFAGTPSRVGGVSWEVLAEEALRRHNLAWPKDQEAPSDALPNPGEFHWRAGGEHHLWNPGAIATLQAAARGGDALAWERFARLADASDTRRGTLRGLLELQPPGDPVPLLEVEPASEMVKRFCTGAKSFGSISAEAHETLAVAMNRLGGRSNTGEGGEDAKRYLPDQNGDSRRSAIKQVASGRFGVTIWYLANADELQIKIAQGAKPGEGGELPGYKVDEVIARTRYSTPGVGLISPPPHHDIYSIEDLAQLIYDLKSANPRAQVSVKLVSEVGVGTIAAGVAKAHADSILISGHDGGTGASPLTSIKHAGLPWELGLAETHQTLVMNDLRSRVVLQTDGQLKTGRDVVIAAILGAEEFGFATAPLIALGCIMMRKCHLNTCPVGIATQNPILRQRFAGLPEHVINYLFLVAEDTRRHLARLGLRQVTEAIGRTDLLAPNLPAEHWKARHLDLSALLAPAQKKAPGSAVYRVQAQDHGLERSLDWELIARAQPALERRRKTRIQLPVGNHHRTVGALLSNEVVRRHGERALRDGTLEISLTGSAGQSFGAFLARGITLELEGDANDYVGKGLSGGRLIVYPPRRSRFRAEDNVLIGNVALYGATSGEAFFRGRAAERFAVRNSGARCVIEGIGDHGCEYMTGGRAVVLGPTGRNFAAGMSGGIAWVWDPHARLRPNTNLQMVELEAVSPEYARELRELIERHARTTGSPVALGLLERFQIALLEFVQVMPHDYRSVLEGRPVADEEEEAA